MRHGPLLVVMLLLVGCGSDGTSHVPTQGFVPTTPTPPMPPTPPASTPTPVDTISAAASGWLWLMVINGSGVCIDSAEIEIVSGQGKGLKGKPSANCDVWDYDGGFILYGLVPGNPLTIRASAPGYIDREETFLPSGAETQQASFIELSKLYGPPSIPLGQPTLEVAGSSLPQRSP